MKIHLSIATFENSVCDSLLSLVVTHIPCQSIWAVIQSVLVPPKLDAS